MHITIVFSIFFCELHVLSLQENMILSIIMSKQMNTIFFMECDLGACAGLSGQLLDSYIHTCYPEFLLTNSLLHIYMWMTN